MFLALAETKESKQEKKVNKMVEIPHYTYIFSQECKKGEYKLKIEKRTRSVNP
jgi:hypothetical protein